MSLFEPLMPGALRGMPTPCTLSSAPSMNSNSAPAAAAKTALPVASTAARHLTVAREPSGITTITPVTARPSITTPSANAPQSISPPARRISDRYHSAFACTRTAAVAATPLSISFVKPTQLPK